MKEADELRIVRNFVSAMPKTYGKRNMNRTIIHDILMRGTSTAGSTSCDLKCRELGIDPYGHNLEEETK